MRRCVGKLRRPHAGLPPPPRACNAAAAASPRRCPAARRYLWGASRALLDRARQPGAAAGSLVVQPSEGVEREAEVSASFQRAYAAFADRVPPDSSIVSRLK